MNTTISTSHMLLPVSIGTHLPWVRFCRGRRAPAWSGVSVV